MGRASPDRPWKCVSCPRSFWTRNGLIRHANMTGCPIPKKPEVPRVAFGFRLAEPESPAPLFTFKRGMRHGPNGWLRWPGETERWLGLGADGSPWVAWTP